MTLNSLIGLSRKIPGWAQTLKLGEYPNVDKYSLHLWPSIVLKLGGAEKLLNPGEDQPRPENSGFDN